MKKSQLKQLLILLLLLILMLIPHDLTSGVTPQANTYDLDWHVIGSGGTSFTTVDNYSLGATIGQPQAGRLSTSNILMNVGFWIDSFFNQFLPIVLR